METSLGSVIIIQSILLLGVLFSTTQRLATLLARTNRNTMLAITLSVLPFVSLTFVTVLTNDLLHWLHSPNIIRIFRGTIRRAA